MSYKTILKSEFVEIIVKKSRFIGYISPCSLEDEAIDFIKSIKNVHPSARHHCFAYVIGGKKESQRYSDDGEPSGTAGIPMLELLKKKDLTDICVVVVRYFGGILLGTNGLIRAYSSACNEVANKAIIVEKKIFGDYNITIDYNDYGKVLNFLENNNYCIYNKNFGESVNLSLYVENSKIDNFNKELLNITSGNIELNLEKTILLNTKNNKIILEG